MTKLIATYDIVNIYVRWDLQQINTCFSIIAEELLASYSYRFAIKCQNNKVIVLFNANCSLRLRYTEKHYITHHKGQLMNSLSTCPSLTSCLMCLI